MAATIKWQTFDSKNLVYSSRALPNGNSGKKIIVEYIDPKTGERVPFRWQSPRAKIPFGVSKWDKDGPVKYSLTQNLSDEDYLAFLEAVDIRNCEAAFEMQSQWFPDKPTKSAEVLNELYIPIVKPAPVGKDYDPTSRFKIPFRMKQIQTKFWNESRVAIPSSEVAPQSEAVTVNELPNLWFVSKQWGASVQVNQAKVYGASERFEAYAIADDGDETMTDIED